RRRRRPAEHIHDRNPVGRILTRFSSDYGNVFRLFGGPLAEFLAIIFDLVIMTILIGVANWVFLIFVAFIASLNYAVYRWRIPHLRVARRSLSSSRSPSIAHYSETAQGSTTIRAFSKEGFFIKRFSHLDSYYLGNKMKTVRQVVGFSFLMNALSSVFLLITGLAGIWMIQIGQTTVGAIGVAFSFIVLSGNAVQMFFEWLSQLEEALVGVERLDRLLRLPLEEQGKLPAWTQFPTPHLTYAAAEETTLTDRPLCTVEKATLEYRNVFFRYSAGLPYLFEGFNFKINPREKLGIIGSTGSGKSTLMQMLMGFYPLEKGEINFAGQSLKEIDLEYFRRHFSVISQETLLFRATLRANLDMENKSSDEEIWQALSRVQMDDWVRSKPDQLNFAVEEKGANLSAGEKQLLSLARCLLQRRPLLVLDEATSHVDPGSEEMMMRASREFFSDRTQIIIAHRLSTLEQCDRILWLEKGRIHSLGPSKEILHQMHCGTDQLLT
ncbi:MAG: ABC transporter ATP-binding protein, partial [Bdellovibrionota bacterium]